jgi:hypothetical protein
LNGLLTAIAEPDGAGRLGHTVDESRHMRFVDEEPARRRAHLAGVPQPPRQSRGGGLIDIRVIEHDERRVAAKLHRDALDGLRTLPNEDLSDARGACEANLAHARRGHQRFDGGFRRPE